MKYSLSTLAVAVGASLAASQCTFSITASGGQSGIVGQLSDGQNRIGGSNSQGTYTISNGQITDSLGRGCILTPPTTQFQCDVGATPTGGFAIGSNGEITFSGSNVFYACPATSDMYNIYTTPVSGQSLCVQVALTASNCFAASAKHTTMVTSTVQKTVTRQAEATTVTSTIQKTVTSQAEATTPTSTTCPANLSGAYQFPHLIVPVSSSSPTTAAGTSYNGVITSIVSSIFNFDIPTTLTGTCSLVFLFPLQSQLTTSSFTFSGNGVLDFKQLTTVATTSTTFANLGTVKTDFGTKTITPGSSTVITTFACPAGQAVSYEISSVSGTSLTYFQDFNPSPIGLYITSC
ncbi:hypothetical protein LHYA1_G001171 [Lachnellula hyalina]|uniref:Ubiquitin 3 binding protein But2 C-terminal domain-containing protein n=1 Tax=Lachnellula hyalina TaxID=1316788 RepID=A0A8H8U1Q6_9HELO|nr:uncharacterized protein LHYA1_G001171 [Lachnellula hyalina]TVY30671.1 hypothetical protein LHYA1_G001171 [Lachnellula hyalina]